LCYRRAVYLNPNFSEAHDKLDELVAMWEYDRSYSLKQSLNISLELEQSLS
jgi:hypothetical protein